MASELYEKGMATRRKVMGEAHIKRRAGRGDELTRRHYELVTEMAWGSVWSRPGLPLKIRSLVTIAMLAALNREDELKGHINGALNNGATSEEIYEVLLQAAVYCGFPVSNNGVRAAVEVFTERGLL
jgi:4-carboxymuconolactone decarboxylase